MQSCFTDLPEELLDIIFDFVREASDFRCLCQCILVCKKWKTSAQRSLYSSIQLESELQTITLLNTMSHKKNRSPGKFTKFLAYNGHYEEREKKVPLWIKLFTKWFPNVRQVFSGKDDPKYYKKLIKAYHQGRWQNLEGIGSCPEESVQNHNECALLHRNTLKILHIHDSHKNSKASNLYNQLELFPNLRQLYIETNRHNFFEFSEHATKHIHKLKTLHYDNLATTNFESLTPYKYVDLSSITPQPEITSLTIEAASYENDNFLLYLMKKYPKLQTISINDLSSAIMYNKVLLDKIKSSKDKFSLSVLSQFMLFVSKCRIHSIDLLYTTLNVDELFIKFWDLCDPGFQKMFAISYAEGSEDWGNIETQPSDDESLAHIYMNADYRTHSNSMIVDYKLCKTVFPHLRLIEKTGKEIDHLVACIGPVFYRDTRIEEDQELLHMLEGKWFSHIVQHCTKLKTLRVLQTHIIWYSSVRDFPINTFITDLTLEQVVICQNTLRRISYLLPSLTRLVLRHIYYDRITTNCDTSKLESIIDMPTATLRFLYAQDCLLDEVKKNLLPNQIQVKLVNAKGVQFYRSVLAKDIDFNLIRTVEDFDDEEDMEIARAISITETEYLDAYADDRCLNLQINCKSIDYLVVSLKEINPELACYVLMVNDDNADLSITEERDLRVCYAKKNYLL